MHITHIMNLNSPIQELQIIWYSRSHIGLVEGNVLVHEHVVRVLNQGTVLDVELLVLKTLAHRSCQSSRDSVVSRGPATI